MASLTLIVSSALSGAAHDLPTALAVAPVLVLASFAQGTFMDGMVKQFQGRPSEPSRRAAEFADSVRDKLGVHTPPSPARLGRRSSRA